MPKSINGWDVMTSYGDSRLKVGTVPGTRVKIRMHHSVLPLFLALAADYHKTVAKLRPAETGAFNPRKSNLSPTKWSDHSSGTAIDINWNHEGAVGGGPYGGMQRMTKAQIAACAALKKKYKVVIWGGDKARGGDYVNSEYWDPMHYAIRPGVTEAQVLKTIADLGIKPDGTFKKKSVLAKAIELTAVENKKSKPTPPAPVKKAPAKKAPAKKAVKKTVAKVTKTAPKKTAK